MDSQYIFENINVYNEIEVDCFQNLLLSYLQLFHADTNYLKICWPWTFERHFVEKNAKRYMILNQHESISLQRISDIYHNKGRQVYFDENADRASVLEEYLKQYQAVFLCIDEYYIGYHYKHVFEKQHGLHTLLVTNIDMEQKVVQGISSIPVFKGNIPLDYFEKALYSPEIKEWFVYFESNKFETNPISSYKESMKKEFALEKSSDNIIYTKDIITHLKGIDFHDSDIEYLCEGTWGWKITAKGEMLIDFIEKEKPFNQKQSEIIEDIKNINLNWSKGYKLLFKFSCSKHEIFFKRAIEYIERAYETECQLQNTIFESIDGEEK